MTPFPLPVGDHAALLAGNAQLIALAEPEPPRRAFTLSLETQFLAAAEIGSTLTVTAEKTGGGRQIFFSRAQAADQDGRLIGQGSGTFRYRSAPARKE